MHAKNRLSAAFDTLTLEGHCDLIYWPIFVVEHLFDSQELGQTDAGLEPGISRLMGRFYEAWNSDKNVIFTFVHIIRPTKTTLTFARNEHMTVPLHRKLPQLSNGARGSTLAQILTDIWSFIHTPIIAGMQKNAQKKLCPPFEIFSALPVLWFSTVSLFLDRFRSLSARFALCRPGKTTLVSNPGCRDPGNRFSAPEIVTKT